MSNDLPYSPSSSLWAGTLLAPFKRKQSHKSEDALQPQLQAMSLELNIDDGAHLLSEDTNYEPHDDDNSSCADDGYVIVQAPGHVLAVEAFDHITEEIDFKRYTETLETSEPGDSPLPAWNHKFGGRRHVELTRNDKEIFTVGRRLGAGGFGSVHETFLDGIAVALKRTYARRLNPHQLNEIKILGRISEERHHHIVDLIGSYAHQQRKEIELGLLIWPVAQTDLSALLHDFWIFSARYSSYLESGAAEPPASLRSAMEPLAALLIPKTNRSSTSSCAPLTLLKRYESRLRTSFGCIAEAVAYLHSRKIRHKDLKPSQILLSPNGLWLTDFGWSQDISELPQSATSGGDNITLKYQAPERANREPCGRSEDIFSLGCIFVETAHTLVTRSSGVKFVRPWSRTGWVFQANLQHKQKWLDPLIYDLPHPMGFHFNSIIERMLASTAKERPRIDTIIKKIKDIKHSDYGSAFACPCYYLPHISANAPDHSHDVG